MIPEAQTLSSVSQDLLYRFMAVRKQSEKLCAPLETEDYVVQPVADVSPPKWHLAHTTWFFEVFVLQPYMNNYRLFHKDFPLLFNSYYVSAGERWTRAERGYLTRPTVQEIYTYRRYVEEQMQQFLSTADITRELAHIMEIGMQHEQQHQELLLYDIKYILGHNPLFPPYIHNNSPESKPGESVWLSVPGGNYKIGYKGDGFCFDNELGVHTAYLHDYEIASQPVTNGEYLQFMEDGGYSNPLVWLSDGWDWVTREGIKSPMYWIWEDNQWYQYAMSGFARIDRNAPVSHVSFYEADAYARWKGVRLPTEFEWETAAGLYESDLPDTANFVENELFAPIGQAGYGFFGNLWEWTSSAYLPYPYYEAPDGALGEYNGKFMVNQKVLRGGSYATPRNHIRLTYRNFFHPHLQWLFNGIRLARHS